MTNEPTLILFFPNWAHCEQAHWLHTLHLTHSTEDSTEFHSTHRLWCLGYHQHHSVKHLKFSCWMTVSWHFLCCASFCSSPSPSELAFHALICPLPLSALVLWKTSPHFFGGFSCGFEALAVKRLCVRACVCVCVCVYRSICVSVTSRNWRILLVQSFTACACPCWHLHLLTLITV